MEKHGNPRDHPKTNVDFITEFMEWGNPLKQVFVTTILHDQAKRLVKLSDEEIRELDKKSPMVNMFAWRAVAQQFLDAWEEFYRPKPKKANQ